MPRRATLIWAIALQCSAAGWAASPAEAIPRMPNGKPDLSGHWSNPYTPDMAAQGKVLDPATRKPLEFSRAPLPDAKASASGSAPRTLDLPYTRVGSASAGRPTTR